MASLVRSVDVGRPVETTFDAWSRIEELPLYVPGVASVRVLDERSSHWVLRIARERREFGAVITEQVPDHRIAWEGRGSPPHRGMVNFSALPGDRTRVTVVAEWEPEGLFDKVGDRFGHVGRALDAALAAFRDRVESTTPLAAGRRAEIPGHRAADPSPADSVVDANRASVTDDGRGRLADSPTEIPAPGWLDILKRAVASLKSDNVPIIAAGVAFYTFLALIPSMLAVVSVYGLVANPADVQRQLEELLGALPSSAAEFMRVQLETIVGEENSTLGFSVAVSIALALFSASKGMQSLVIALNVAYDEEETRKFVRLRLLALLLTLATTAGAVVLVGGMSLLGAVADGLGTVGGVVLTVVRWPLLGALLVGGLAVLYRYAPDRDKARWRWVTPGALVAVVLWLLASLAFSVYVNNFGSYNETYGTLAGIVVLLLWLFLSAYIIILGAEFDAEAERQTARDSTVGTSQPLGTRRAYAADTVAPAPARK